MSDLSAFVPPAVATHRDEAGREFGFVHVRHPGSRGLVVHFSAFFGRWGNARAYRDTFQGYFHRLKMLGSCPDHDWLFLCDTYGAFDNGSYYLGPRGDHFVDRATRTIIADAMVTSGVTSDELVLLGSSMGGTAALRLGLATGARGVLAVGPHIDLDTSAVRQDRMAEVAWTLTDGDVTAVHNRDVTRAIRRAVEDPRRATPLPRLFIQSCRDDAGVHEEQVRPLVDAWHAAGGELIFDERPTGGHTSEHATRPLLVDVVGRLLDGVPIDPAVYQRDDRYQGTPVAVPFSHHIRGHLGRMRQRLRTRVQIH